jgi:hypothetical protein
MAEGIERGRERSRASSRRRHETQITHQALVVGGQVQAQRSQRDQEQGCLHSGRLRREQQLQGHVSGWRSDSEANSPPQKSFLFPAPLLPLIHSFRRGLAESKSLTLGCRSRFAKYDLFCDSSTLRCETFPHFILLVNRKSNYGIAGERQEEGGSGASCMPYSPDGPCKSLTSLSSSCMHAGHGGEVKACSAPCGPGHH